MKRIFIIISLFLFSASTVSAAVFTPYKILIVPGHDDHSFGTRYGNMKEADMTLDLSEELFEILEKDYRFEVYITRDEEGFTEEIAKYFAEKKDEINYFIENSKAKTAAQIKEGNFRVRTAVPHRAASEDVAYRLYGMNKWLNEQEINAVVHVHFNDNARKSRWVIGKYSGFAVYVPDKQFPNAEASLKLGQNIFDELKKKYPTSTYPDEKGGLIQDQKLIALGSNGTLEKGVNSVLIEYGYIYEKIFRTLATRQAAYKDMASRTAAGITNFFFPQ